MGDEWFERHEQKSSGRKSARERKQQQRAARTELRLDEGRGSARAVRRGRHSHS